MEFRGSKFFPIAEFQEQVISLIGRVGVTESFGASAKSQTKTINYFDSQGSPKLRALVIFRMCPSTIDSSWAARKRSAALSFAPSGPRTPVVNPLAVKPMGLSA